MVFAKFETGFDQKARRASKRLSDSAIAIQKAPQQFENYG